MKRKKTLPEVLTALDEAISITKEDQAERFLKASRKRGVEQGFGKKIEQ